jgi:hypothetical protein
MMGKDNSNCCGKVFGDEIGLLTQRFVIAVVEENCAAAGGVTAVNIPPAIPHHPTAGEIEAELSCRREQHGRFWFPAIAGLAVVCAAMITHLDQVDLRDECVEPVMHRFDHGLRLGAASHIRLVGGEDQDETRILQPRTALAHSREQNESLHGEGRIRFPLFDNRGIERAVTVEENSWFG